MPKPKPKTKDEIDREILALQALIDNPKFPRTNFFRESNVDAINAQIKMLKLEVTEDQIYDEFDDYNQQVAADDAHDWMMGYNPSTPSIDWAKLLPTGSNER